MSEIVKRLPAALAEVQTPAEADLLRREVEAFIAIARKAPAKQIEVEWPALLRLRLDAWRKWGEMLGEAERDKPPPGGVTDGHAMDDAERKRRERARKLAFDVPDDEYHRYRAQENADKLTLAGVADWLLVDLDVVRDAGLIEWAVDVEGRERLNLDNITTFTWLTCSELDEAGAIVNTTLAHAMRGAAA